MYGDNTPPPHGAEEVTPSGEKFFTVDIFRKYAKPMVNLHIIEIKGKREKVH